MELPGYYLIPWMAAGIIGEILGFSIGFLWGHAFRKFDSNMKYGSWGMWYQKQNPAVKRFIDCVLDANHHFQYGLSLMLLMSMAVFMPEALPPNLGFLIDLHIVWKIIIYATGVGQVASDLRDYKWVLKRLTGIQSELTGSSNPEKKGG